MKRTSFLAGIGAVGAAAVAGPVAARLGAPVISLHRTPALGGVAYSWTIGSRACAGYDPAVTFRNARGAVLARYMQRTMLNVVAPNGTVTMEVEGFRRVRDG